MERARRVKDVLPERDCVSQAELQRLKILLETACRKILSILSEQTQTHRSVSNHRLAPDKELLCATSW